MLGLRSSLRCEICLRCTTTKGTHTCTTRYFMSIGQSRATVWQCIGNKKNTFVRRYLYCTLYFRTFVLSKYNVVRKYFRTFVRKYESTFESIIFVLSYMYCTRTTSSPTKVCAFVRVKNPKGHAAAFEWTGDASGGIPQMRFK